MPSLLGMIVKVGDGIPHYASIVFKSRGITNDGSVQLVETPMHNGTVGQLDLGNIVERRCFGIIGMPTKVTRTIAVEGDNLGEESGRS